MIYISRLQLSELISHALETDPEECCGFLIGSAGRSSSVRRTTNTRKDSRNLFAMSEMEVERVREEAATAGLMPIAVYHSHTYTQAYPSETDVTTAVKKGWAGYHHVLISLAEKTRPVVRAFMIDGQGKVAEEFIDAS